MARIATVLDGHKKRDRDQERMTAFNRQQRHRYNDATAMAASQCGMDYTRVHIPTSELMLTSFTDESRNHPDLDGWRRDHTPVSFELTHPAISYGDR